MIDSISGLLIQKIPTCAVVDVGGIRLKVNITISTYERLPSIGSNTELLVYLHVREDILALYGFDHEDQRSMFLLLIGISGIGPRSAMGILSGASISEFKKRIVAGDVKSLTVIPGIGPKTAKRIIVELKEKFVMEKDDDISMLFDAEKVPDEMDDTIQALQSLGYSRAQAHKAMKKLEKSGDLTGNLEELLKKALKKM
jgi:Holliday junction DNA helicase RuvA